MNEIHFQLGHCPELSYAELVSVNQRLGEPLKSLRFDSGAAFAETGTLEKIPAFCNELGGTIRVCGVEYNIDNFIVVDDASDLADAILISVIESGVLSQIQKESGKGVFGLSWLAQKTPPGGKRRLHKTLQLLAARIKDHLKENEVSCRFVLPQDQNDVCLSGAQVEKNNLLEKGVEIGLYWDGASSLCVTATRWLQPYEAFSQRDYGRPQRDARSGMLPPKLARMMINLARTADTRMILDPFCGSGSVLMEAWLMGLDATGIDLSGKAVEDTVANYEWLKKQRSGSPSAIYTKQADARTMHSLFEPLYFDACATEPYLGPPSSKPLTEAQFEKISEELEELYVRVLGEIRTVVKPGARVVFIVPKFKIKEKQEASSLRVISNIRFLGYKILDPLDNFNPTDRRVTLLYSRPNQVVQREIFVLQA